MSRIGSFGTGGELLFNDGNTSVSTLFTKDLNPFGFDNISGLDCINGFGWILGLLRNTDLGFVSGLGNIAAGFLLLNIVGFEHELLWDSLFSVSKTGELEDDDLLWEFCKGCSLTYLFGNKHEISGLLVDKLSEMSGSRKCFFWSSWAFWICS